MEACIRFLRDEARVELLKKVPVATLRLWASVLLHWSVLCDDEARKRND